VGKVTSFINFKGGVGKTTVAVNVAACLATSVHNKRVLLIDLDAQSNASIWLLGQDHWSRLNTSKKLSNTAYGLFSGNLSESVKIVPYQNARTKSFLPDLSLIPASFHMVGLEDRIFKQQGMYRLADKYRKWDEYLYLKEPLERLREEFDHVIIDCPPNLYNVTRNALCHSDYIIVPCIPDSLSTMGLRLLLRELESIVRPLAKAGKIERTPVVLGVVLTKFKAPLTEHRQGIDRIASALKDFREKESNLLFNGCSTVFEEQPIREYVAHLEAVQSYQPLCLFGPLTKAYSDVQALTQTLLDTMEIS